MIKYTLELITQRYSKFRSKIFFERFINLV